MATTGDPVLPTTTVLQSHRLNGLPIYKFQRLSEFSELEHAIFTRLGGVSSVPFASLNASYDTGDEAINVKENLRRIRLALGFPSLVYGRQSHGTNILILRDQPVIDLSTAYPFQSIDGFVTRLAELPLMIKVADCQVILLYEPNKRVAAATHTGWRGSVQNIVGKTVQLMEANFNCRPRDIIAAIGPSLGPCCAEFRNWRFELPQKFARFRLGESNFDFWAITRHQLLESGLLNENIETAGLCNKCHPEIFYSYRGEHETGRFAAAIAIRGQ